MIIVIPLAYPLAFVGSTGARRRAAIERPFRQPRSMILHIRGPRGDQFFETNWIAGKQRPDRVFVMRLVAGHRPT